MIIPTEDNYIDWTLQGIRDYFRRIDYRVRTYSIGQVRERQCPVDRVLAVGNKLVGLQFKRPRSDGPPWNYPTTPHQHADITRARWIFYVLPDFADPRLQEVALFHCRFSSAVEDRVQGKTELYYRWGAFANALIECRVGIELREQGTERGHQGDDRTADALFHSLLEAPRDLYLALNRQAEEAYLIRRGEESDMEREPA